ncbi:MAG: DUF721 domain-containing protein [Symploca sp. SIO3C6]|nr:DUF721 domain-containing protein [Symploca sp. SIO3C6]NET08229.1 DUF721 domain-containing protein [Symploca sp. SIO2B6]NET50174.1 DUF721 domain-containing protein [Merismopedia sp. SIO2A8]
MFKSIDHILDVLENQPHLEGIKKFQRLLKGWPQIVGATAAQHTRPYSISRDVLYVATSSSAWAQELKFRRISILKKLNAQFPNLIVDIRFSTAEWQD